LRLLTMYLVKPGVDVPEITDEFFESLSEPKACDLVHPLTVFTGGEKVQIRYLLERANYLAEGQGVIALQYVIPQAMESSLQYLYPVTGSWEVEHTSLPLTKHTIFWMHSIMLPWMSVFGAVEVISLYPMEMASLSIQGVRDLDRLCSVVRNVGQ
jgi:hypothetical protein